MSLVIEPSVGGQIIYMPQGFTLNESLEEFGGYSDMRMMEGSAVRQTHWTKLRANFSGSGFIPSGIRQLDISVSHIIKCGVPHCIVDTDTAATLPTARRTDVPDICYAVNASGYAQKTPVVVTGDAATATAVAGAVAYLYFYYPQFTAFISPVQESGSRNDSTYSWSFTAEEV